MKRLIPVLLILLLFAGCTSETSDQPTTQSTVPAKIGAAYSQNSTVEGSTDGAVTQFSLTGQIDAIDLVDKGVVLSNEQGKIGLLTDNHSFIISSDVDGLALLSAQEKKLVCYNSAEGLIVVADDTLKITDEFKLEDGISGLPVYGVGTNEIYYCVEGYIRALDLGTGLTRHVIQHAQEGQMQISCYFDGSVIGRSDEKKTAYLSSVDGQTVFVESSLRDFVTGTTNYYGIYRDGFVDQYVWGDADGEALQLMLPSDETVYPQMHADCVVTVQKTEANTAFRRYDMGSGLCIGRVEFKTAGSVLDIASDGSVTWILTDGALYRWDYSLSPNNNSDVYTIPLITAENPDSEGIEQCRTRAESIAAAHGVQIHLWDEALLNDETYTITGEYQTETIEAMLDELEVQLPQMPDQIFIPTEEYCGIQICLVRSIEGQDFIQYWAEGGLCIAITPTADVQEALLTGLGWGIDSRVIGNSRDLDYWDDLNPEGFTYDYSYFVNAQRTDLQYLEGEDRAFTDQRSMSFPSEDRARIFYYSLLEGNEDLFSSEIMQAKLKTFCEGIREAYGWQKEEQTYPWEQYLDESLAYTK